MTGDYITRVEVGAIVAELRTAIIRCSIAAMQAATEGNEGENFREFIAALESLQAIAYELGKAPAA